VRVVVVLVSLPARLVLAAWPLAATIITTAGTVALLLLPELRELTAVLAVLPVALRAVAAVAVLASPIPSQPIPEVPVRPATMAAARLPVPPLAVVAVGPMQARVLVPVVQVACVSSSGRLSSDPLQPRHPAWPCLA
jgi:hypothetical protein